MGTSGNGNLNISTVGILEKSILEANNISIGKSGGTGSATVSGFNANLIANNVLTVGEGAGSVGSLLISNKGKVTVADSLFVGVNSTSSLNTVGVSGAGSELVLGNDVMHLGFGGTGRLLVENGGKVTNTQSLMGLGNTTGASGTVTVTGAGSHFSSTGAQTMVVGAGGSGELVVSNGALADIHRVQLAQLAGSTGTMTVTGTNSLLNLHGSTTNIIGDQGVGSAFVSNNGVLNSNSGISLGQSGVGTLSVTTGGKVYSTSGNIGGTNGAAGSKATINGAGSLWSNTGGIDVGWSQAAELEVANGGTVNSNGGRLGVSSTGNGVANVSGTGATWNTFGSSPLVLGQSGQGTVNVSAGGQVNSSGVMFASQASGVGNATISGANSNGRSTDLCTWVTLAKEQ